MQVSPNSTCLGSKCNGKRVLLRSEQADLKRLAGLARKLFHVPVGYAAMLGHHDRVMSRIGSGREYSPDLKALFPLSASLLSPQVIQDARRDLATLREGNGPRLLGEDLPGAAAEPGKLSCELMFAASAPIDTLCGQHMGVLVIADCLPHPEFSAADLETLAQMAGVMADTVEMRMIAAQARDWRLSYGEAEKRFRSVANSAPALIACAGPDGSCEFVNDAWLAFTGRRRREELGDGWQQIIHPSHRQHFLNLFLQALQTQKPFTADLPMRRCDGVWRAIRGRVTPRFLPDSTFAGFTARLTDWSAFQEEVAESLPESVREGQAA
jgi:PAS domain S-box-containing protein